MVKVSKTYPPQKQVLKDIYLSFFYGAKIVDRGYNFIKILNNSYVVIATIGNVTYEGILTE